MDEETAPVEKAETSYPEGWREAAAMLQKLNRPPPNIFGLIRSFLSADVRNQTVPSDVLTSEFIRLFKSKTIRSMYQYVAESYRAPSSSENAPKTPREFLNTFTPFEHGVILSICYLYRAVLKKSDPEEWSYIQMPFYDSLEVGALIGAAVPKIGLGFGLLTRGIRYLALAPMLWNSKNSFKEYRRHLKTNDQSFDSVFEQNAWGCTSIHVASLMLQSMGFNSKVSNAFFKAISGTNLEELDQHYGTSFLAANLWMNTMMDAVDPPRGLAQEYLLDSSAYVSLSSKIQAAVNVEGRTEWLNREKK